MYIPLASLPVYYQLSRRSIDPLTKPVAHLKVLSISYNTVEAVTLPESDESDKSIPSSAIFGAHEHDLIPLDLSSLIADSDPQIKNEILHLETKISTIDLNISSTHQYRSKAAEPSGIDILAPIPSLLRRACNFLERIGWSTLSTAVAITKSALPGALDDAFVQKPESIAQKSIQEQPTLANSTNRPTETPQRNTDLPIELWGHIFLLCLPEDQFVQPDPRQAPLLLCQICTQWRRVAVGTPLLWNALSIRPSWKRRIWRPSLESWLERSGNAFLYLDVSIPTFMDESCVDQHVLKTIIDASDRWHHLRLNLSSSLLRTVLSQNMPLLRKLELSSGEHILDLHIEPERVPNLKKVSSLTKAIYLRSLSLPWTQLTHLSSQCWLNISQHVEILSKCPNLESYTMCLIPTDRPWHHNVKTLLHHNLRTLHITSFVEKTSVPNVDMDLLQLPNLADLMLVIPKECPGYGMMDWPKAEILSLIQRSSCTLLRVRFQGIFLTEDDILDASKIIPSPAILDFQWYEQS